MPQLSDVDRTIFKNVCGVSDFTDAELAEIDEMAQRLKNFLAASDKRQQERIAKAGR